MITRGLIPTCNKRKTWTDVLDGYGACLCHVPRPPARPGRATHQKEFSMILGSLGATLFALLAGLGILL